MLTAAARAQCDGGIGAEPEGTLRDTFPADLGVDLPTDGLVRLRYVRRPPSPATICVRPRDAEGCIAGRASIVGDELVWQAAAPFAVLTSYVATFSDTVGGSNLIRFRTGRGPSATAPRFGGLSSVTLAGESVEPCDPGAVDITVRFERAQRSTGASDLSWPDTDIEYVLFVTRGVGVSGPRALERARVQGSGSSADRTAQRTVRVPSTLASGPLCLTMQAFDPSGRSDGNSVERCVNPAQGNFFVSCTSAPTSATRSPWVRWSSGSAERLRPAMRRRQPSGESELR
jgi:hypothetical protein